MIFYKSGINFKKILDIPEFCAIIDIVEEMHLSNTEATVVECCFVVIVPRLIFVSVRRDYFKTYRFSEQFLYEFLLK